MSIERTFLFSLLVGGDGESESAEDRMRFALRQGIDEEAFADPDYREVWRFIENHFSRFGSVPSIEVTEIECDVRFPDYAPEEPFRFWLEQLRLFQKHVFMADAVEHINEELTAGRTLQAEELVARTHQGLVSFDISTNAFSLQDLTEDAIRQHDEIQRHRREPGIPVGLPYLNTVTGGAQPGDVWVIAGRPASGKSFVVGRIAMGAWSLRRRVLIVSMEMAAIQFGRRNASMGAGVTSKFLRLGRLSGFAVQRLREFHEEVRERNDPESFMVVEGRLNLSVRDVVSYIRQYNPDMVIVDGAYMLKPAASGYKSHWENTLTVTNELKQVAQNVGVPIIATHQFNRKGDKEKSLGNIAYADTIGQIASVVLGLSDERAMQNAYTPVVYKVLEILKGREGETGQIRIRCDMRVTSIEESEVLVGDSSLLEESQQELNEPDMEDDEWEQSGASRE